jgi:hypothetical protein
MEPDGVEVTGTEVQVPHVVRDTAAELRALDLVDIDP